MSLIAFYCYFIRYFVSFLFWVTFGTAYLSLLCSPRLFTPNSPLSSLSVFSSDSPLLPANAARMVKKFFNPPQVYSHLYEEVKKREEAREKEKGGTGERVSGGGRRIERLRKREGVRDPVGEVGEDPHPQAEPETGVEESRKLSNIPQGLAQYVDNPHSLWHQPPPSPPSPPGQLIMNSPSLWDQMMADEFLVYFAVFMVAVGVCIATSTLLSLHMYLGKLLGIVSCAFFYHEPTLS
ncbi:hypothetical protein EON65_06305, partial [archaeon]